VFCYCQFQTEDAGEHGSAEESRRNSSFEKTDWGGCQRSVWDPPFKARTTTVSSIGSIIILCQKQLSLKLLVKGGVTVL